MENDPLKKLIDIYKSEGYEGKEAVEEAKIELANRRRERELELGAISAKLESTPSRDGGLKKDVDLMKEQLRQIERDKLLTRHHSVHRSTLDGKLCERFPHRDPDTTALHAEWAGYIGEMRASDALPTAVQTILFNPPLKKGSPTVWQIARCRLQADVKVGDEICALEPLGGDGKDEAKIIKVCANYDGCMQLCVSKGEAVQPGRKLCTLRPLSNTVEKPDYNDFKANVMKTLTTAWTTDAEKAIQDAFEALLFPLSGDAQEVDLSRRRNDAELPTWMRNELEAQGFHHGGYAPFKFLVYTLLSKKPDSVRYAVGSEGELCMVVVGEFKVKKWGENSVKSPVTDNTETNFSDADRYELFEYLEILMDHQPDRTFCYGFLSAGCRTQIARVTRGDSGYTYCTTAEFTGEDAVWAVLSLMMMDPAKLGYKRLDLSNSPGRTVSRTLSVSAETIVLETQQKGSAGCTTQVMKLFRSHRGEERCDHEVRMISAARGALTGINSAIRKQALLACLPEVVGQSLVGYGEEEQLHCVTFSPACTPIQELSTVGGVLTGQQQAQLVELLFHLHRAGVLHRDIKPSNIMLHTTEDAPSQVVLIDFDCAIKANVDLTQRGATATSPEGGWAGNMQCGVPPSEPYRPCARDDLIQLVRAFYLNATLDLVPHLHKSREESRKEREAYWAKMRFSNPLYRAMEEAVQGEGGNPYEALLKFLLPADSLELTAALEGMREATETPVFFSSDGDGDGEDEAPPGPAMPPASPSPMAAPALMSW